MREIKFLTEKEVIRYNMEVCKRYKASHNLRDYALLESAIQSTFYFNNEIGFLHGTTPELAAALCYKLSKNHAFIDGNKRTAAMATNVFLDLNNYDLNYKEYGQEDTELHHVILDTVCNRINLDNLKIWFLEHAVLKSS